jgi:hypothetical protein
VGLLTTQTSSYLLIEDQAITTIFGSVVSWVPSSRRGNVAVHRGKSKRWTESGSYVYIDAHTSTSHNHPGKTNVIKHQTQLETKIKLRSKIIQKQIPNIEDTRMFSQQL